MVKKIAEASGEELGEVCRALKKRREAEEGPYNELPPAILHLAEDSRRRLGTLNPQ